MKTTTDLIDNTRKILAQQTLSRNEKLQSIAELDIDSHTKNAITEDHQEMLEEICDIIAELF